MADSLVGVTQSASPDRQIDNDSDGAKYRQKVWDAGPIGTWAYHAGVSGTVTCGATERLVSLSCISSGAAAVVINGGDSIPVPSCGLSVDIKGSLTAPVVVFTGTISYFCEVVS